MILVLSSISRSPMRIVALCIVVLLQGCSSTRGPDGGENSCRICLHAPQHTCVSGPRVVGRRADFMLQNQEQFQGFSATFVAQDDGNDIDMVVALFSKRGLTGRDNAVLAIIKKWNDEKNPDRYFTVSLQKTPGSEWYAVTLTANVPLTKETCQRSSAFCSVVSRTVALAREELKHISRAIWNIETGYQMSYTPEEKQDVLPDIDVDFMIRSVQDRPFLPR